MLGIVVTGHINFASGLQSAFNAIVGTASQIKFVDFTEDLSPEELLIKFQQAKEEVDDGSGCLFLTDIYGGTPNNQATQLMLTADNVEVICGVNLPMLINSHWEREELNLQELVKCLLSGATDLVKDVRHEYQRINAQSEQIEEDGL